jgi:hypothetical protein
LAGTVVFTLPSGFTPAVIEVPNIATTNGGAGWDQLSIATNGVVTLFGGAVGSGTPTETAFSGVGFATD